MRKQSEEYAEIGYKLIRERDEFEELRDAEISLAFLADDRPKTVGGKIIFGECEKVQDKYSWCCPYDMAIIVYDRNVSEYNFDAHQLETLIRHELMHVGIRYGKKGISYYIIPHDIEDFKAIIKDEGTDWAIKNYKGSD